MLGLSHRTFDRAESFLAEYAPGLFDCVITDVKMPGIGGLELLQRLRGLGSTMPAIIITSHTDSATRARPFGGAAQAFTPQPFSNDAIIHHLKILLNLGS